MWRDHPFSQRNKATKRVWGGAGVEGGGRTKFEKRGVGGNISGVFIT